MPRGWVEGLKSRRHETLAVAGAGTPGTFRNRGGASAGAQLAARLADRRAGTGVHVTKAGIT